MYGVSLNEDELKQLITLAESIKKKLEDDIPKTLPLFNPEDFFEVSKNNDDDKPLNANLKNIEEEQRVNTGIVDVFGHLYDEMRFNEIFQGRFASTNNSILKSCVLSRIANPSSKSRTSELLESDFGITLPVDKIYRMMDQLNPLTERLKNFVRDSTLNILSNEVNVLLYDVTTLSFQSTQDDELKNFGFSKDCKFKEVQLVLAFIATTKGLPISYEVFPGNTQEVKTLIPSINKLKENFNINEIEFVADRGMYCKNNLNLLDEEGINFVVAAKLRNMSKEQKTEILKIKDNNFNDEFRTLDLDYEGRRLIISYSPERSIKDKRDRERLLERLNGLTNSSGEVAVSKLVKNSGTKKYLKFEKINSKKEKALLDEEKIKEDELWDGIHGLIINSKSLSPEDAIKKYKNLWQIEETFRINKHDLKMRPIFHHKGDRIISHLNICFLAYALARQVMYRLEIQQNERVSFEMIRNSLLQTQASILFDKKTKKRYWFPSKKNQLAKKIYKIFGLKKTSSCKEI